MVFARWCIYPECSNCEGRISMIQADAFYNASDHVEAFESLGFCSALSYAQRGRVFQSMLAAVWALQRLNYTVDIEFVVARFTFSFRLTINVPSRAYVPIKW